MKGKPNALMVNVKNRPSRVGNGCRLLPSVMCIGEVIMIPHASVVDSLQS